MPLPLPQVSRKPIHNRSIRVQSYQREDGLFDLEAELFDCKSFPLESGGRGTLAPGQPVHHIHLRITIDDEFNIVAAQAMYDSAPYGKGCTAIEPQYEDLVGLNLMRGFREKVNKRFGRVAGCTHITELTRVLPTAAVQTMAGLPGRPIRGNPTERPFQLDGCHALRVDGPVVAELYPRWYMVPAGGAPNAEVDALISDDEAVSSVVSPSSDS